MRARTPNTFTWLQESFATDSPEGRVARERDPGNFVMDAIATILEAKGNLRDLCQLMA
jgi:hypothetical protein